MPDIFLSYNREDQSRAKVFAQAFEGQGFSVWWDVGLQTGEAYDEVTEAALRAAKAVVVLWSPRSVVSRWVRAEATLADRNKTLVPCMIEACERPIMFELTQTAELSHWSGDAQDRAWLAFVEDVRRFVGKGEAASVAGKAAIAAPALALPDKPSLAVMPFANLSNDPEQEFFADGMMEEIVAGLTRFKSLFVIASSSTLSFKGRVVSPADVAKRLGVRYVLEGSVRKAGDRVRISVKLVDAADGSQVWAEKFEDTLHDVFALQDRVAMSVAGAIEPAIWQADLMRMRQRPTESLTSYELYLRALSQARGFRREGVTKACELGERALAMDRKFDLAAANLANGLALLLVNGWAENPDAVRARALELANGIGTQGGDNALALAIAGNAIGMIEGGQRAIPLVERALALNPGSGFVRFVAGMNYVRTGHLDLAVTHLETAMRLDPLSPVKAAAEFFVAVTLMLEGRDEEAMAILRNNIHRLPLRLVVLAIVHARLGHAAEAKAMLVEFRAQSPAPPEGIVAAYGSTSEAHRQRLKEGLALALAAEQA